MVISAEGHQKPGNHHAAAEQDNAPISGRVATPRPAPGAMPAGK